MSNPLYFNFTISQSDRSKITKHHTKLIWFTGLSGSGKSTLANALEVKLNSLNYLTYTLDGDNLRSGINNDLGFSKDDRRENLRRAAEIAKILMNTGAIIIGAFVSPLESDRRLVKEIIGEENYIEIFVNTSIEECEKRDVKGLYKKAKAGEIRDFTGISAPYETPLNPFMEIKTEDYSIAEITEMIYFKINTLGIWGR